jgi:hypothetical protein
MWNVKIKRKFLHQTLEHELYVVVSHSCTICSIVIRAMKLDEVSDTTKMSKEQKFSSLKLTTYHLLTYSYVQELF